MTALDKQAREYWEKYFGASPDDTRLDGEEQDAAKEEIKFAAAFATQVREQTVQEIAQFVEDKERAAFEITDEDWHSVLAEEIRALPAPPETTEQG